MKREDQLSMFEPQGIQALDLLNKHRRDFLYYCDAADLWEACLCPGARDLALQQADASYLAWLTFAILLDLEREAQL